MFCFYIRFLVHDWEGLVQGEQGENECSWGYSTFAQGIWKCECQIIVLVLKMMINNHKQQFWESINLGLQLNHLKWLINKLIISLLIDLSFF